MKFLLCLCHPAATPLYGFDTGADPIVLESVGCTGMEPNISSCPTSPIGEINNSVCRESNRAAGVRCSSAVGTCFDGQVRLVGGSAFYEGRLEVCTGNQWLSVCEAGFNRTTANSVCSDRLLLGGSKCMYNASLSVFMYAPYIMICRCHSCLWWCIWIWNWTHTYCMSRQIFFFCQF